MQWRDAKIDSLGRNSNMATAIALIREEHKDLVRVLGALEMIVGGSHDNQRPHDWGEFCRRRSCPA